MARNRAGPHRRQHRARGAPRAWPGGSRATQGHSRPQHCASGRSRTSTPRSPGSGSLCLALACTPTRGTANPGRSLPPTAQAPGAELLPGARRPAPPVQARGGHHSRSVDSWPMATANVYAFGGRPQPPACPQGVGGEGFPPSESPMSRSVMASLPERPRGGRALGELSGGNWMGAACV